MKTGMICENCGKEVTGEEYTDEYSFVEINYDCPHCGFKRRWAYGYTQFGDSEYLKDAKKRWDICIATRKNMAYR